MSSKSRRETISLQRERNKLRNSCKNLKLRIKRIKKIKPRKNKNRNKRNKRERSNKNRSGRNN